MEGKAPQVYSDYNYQLDSHIFREAAYLLLYPKLCLSRSRLSVCERPLPSESLCLTFGFFPSKFLPICYSHSFCNQQLIPIYSFHTCPDFVGLVPLFYHHSTSALVISSLVSNSIKLIPHFPRIISLISTTFHVAISLM